jgi:methionyl-tRNA formyltransferase
VVLLAGPGPSTNIVYHFLARRFTTLRLVVEQPPSRRGLLARRLKKLGPLVVGGQLAFQLGLVPVLAGAARRRIREIVRQHGLCADTPPAQATTAVESVNSPATLALLHQLRPQVVVINGTRIISREVLEAVPVPFINMHAGITPLYRGVHGAYWALTRGDRRHCGVTVHLVDQGIDTGSVLGQAAVQPTATDCFVTYPYLQVAAGLPLLAAAVAEALAGRTTTVPPPTGPSRLWSHPTVWHYLWYWLCRGVR